jgi:cyclopropane fatty-acyl-phospholipid synthase-like methyltransferase
MLHRHDHTRHQASIGTPPYPYPGSIQPRGPDDLYTSPPPWDIGHPQPAFRALGEAGALHGRVLDVGCGTGEHALMAASLGLQATGVDLAGAALEKARDKALRRGLTVRFVRHDARQLGELGETFDTVLDCGLFHIFGDSDRAEFVHALGSVVPPGGRYFMLGFSDQQPGDWGPHRLKREEITDAFAYYWQINSLEPATIEVTTESEGIHAWLLAATRINDSHAREHD